MSIEDLESVAQAMVAPGKDIIAIDESTATIKKRFESVGIENTEENRRAYRELLLTSPGLSDHISGAILYDETIRQSTKDGVPFPQLMKKLGIIPGIKVDKGPQPLAGFPGDVVTEGLDGLRERLQEYAKLGAQFAKWRAVINITEENPSSTAIEANAHALARYAALCQEAGIVFLSGGQSDKDATAHLNAMNRMGPHPWPLSFSYGRAMQQAALKLWSEDMVGKYAAAQQTVSARAKDNGLAALGQWKG